MSTYEIPIKLLEVLTGEINGTRWLKTLDGTQTDIKCQINDFTSTTDGCGKWNFVLLLDLTLNNHSNESFLINDVGANMHMNKIHYSSDALLPNNNRVLKRGSIESYNIGDIEISHQLHPDLCDKITVPELSKDFYIEPKGEKRGLVCFLLQRLDSHLFINIHQGDNLAIAHYPRNL